MTNTDKLIIGSEEWCRFDELELPAILARVDSGAKTSSLHAFNIRPFQRDEQTWVRFDVHPIQGDRRTTVRCEGKVCDHRMVKSSSGLAEKRYVISSRLSLGGQQWDIEVTLSNRDSMGYRMLLGREAMQDRILVDPAASFHQGQISEQQLERFYGQQQSHSSSLKIGLLGSDPALYSNRRLLEAGEQRGHQMQFLNISQCYMKLNRQLPEIHYRNGAILNDFDAVIPRISRHETVYGCALTRHFESLGVFSLNAAEAIYQSRDPFYSLQILHRSGLPIPTTGFANNPDSSSDFIDMLGGAPMVLTLLESSRYRGSILLETIKSADSAISASSDLGNNLLVQHYLHEAQGRSLRLLVLNGKVIASLQRQASADKFHSDSEGSACKTTGEERKLAIKAVKTLGLKLASVSMIRSQQGPVLLAVNSMPELHPVESVSGLDIADSIIGAIEKGLGVPD